MINIPLIFESDKKGYIDRECPECEFLFKINIEDLKKLDEDSNYSDMSCPRCGHYENIENWFTKEQVDAIENLMVGYAENYISKKIDEIFSKLAKDTRNNKYLKIKYKPDRNISFTNNPITQINDWELDIICENCGTRYSVIGAAYFCPICGKSSVNKVIDDSLNRIVSMIINLENLKKSYKETTNDNIAQSICDKLIENSISEVVSAFQNYAVNIFENITNKTKKPNDFQMIYKGSYLFEKETGYSYNEWCNEDDIRFLNIMFNRRHLYEHRNGIVDQKYIDKTKDNHYKLGQRIVTNKEDIKKLVNITKKLCNGLKNI